MTIPSKFGRARGAWIIWGADNPESPEKTDNPENPEKTDNLDNLDILDNPDILDNLDIPEDPDISGCSGYLGYP